MTAFYRTVMDEIRRHGVEEYPNECCGAVISDAGGNQRVVRVRNIQDEMHAEDPERFPRTARIAYTGHPADLFELQRELETGGASLLAFYHSHPDHDAYFSAEDLAQATPLGEPSYPDVLQIVVSVREGRVGQVKAFAWSPAAETYLEHTLEEQ